MTVRPWTFFTVEIAGWMNRQQQKANACLREENRLLRPKIGQRRLIPGDGRKRPLATANLRVGRRLLEQRAAFFSPETLLNL